MFEKSKREKYLWAFFQKECSPKKETHVGETQVRYRNGNFKNLIEILYDLFAIFVQDYNQRTSLSYELAQKVKRKYPDLDISKTLDVDEEQLKHIIDVIASDERIPIVDNKNHLIKEYTKNGHTTIA